MKIYFLVATQHDNLGDLLINKMLIDELAKQGSVYIDAAGLPNSFKNVLLRNKNVINFEKEYNGSLKRITGIKLMSKVKQDFTYYFKSPGPSGGIKLNFKGIFKSLILSFQYNYFNKGGLQLNLVGNDIIVDSMVDRFITKLDRNSFKNILVRSNENVNHLKKMGLKNVYFIPDVAFLYEMKNNIKKVKDNIYISFRDLKDQSYKDKIINYLEEIIPFYISLGLKIVFFYQVESDKNFNTDLFSKFKSDQVFFKDKCFEYDDIHNYHSAKYVITNRLHVMILGIMHNAVPLLVLNDDSKTSKINRILSDNKLDNLILEDKEMFKVIENNFNDICSNLHQVILSNKQNCQQTIKSLF